MEDLAKLKTVFKEGGTVTAATSSQMSDAAAMVVLMTARKAEALGIKPLAKFVSFGVRGLDPCVMGLAPRWPCPLRWRARVSPSTRWTSLRSMRLCRSGHPLHPRSGHGPQEGQPQRRRHGHGPSPGATGAILTIKAVSEMNRIGGKYCMVTMCIGGGMGAAGIFEAV